MLYYPNLDPNALTFGNFSIKWYGVCHFIAFLWCYWVAMVRRPKDFSKEQLTDLLFYVALGMLFGGRIGYMLFYDPAEVLQDPLALFKFWLPGRSFHGGLLGVMLVAWIYAKATKRIFLDLTDFLVALVPIGLALGRIGNFINGELWGRVTNMPWGMIFPYVDRQPRHPSQLYELCLEGVLLFILLNLSYWRKNLVFAKQIANNRSAWFLILYASLRIWVEFYREPDLGLGLFYGVTMGQILSLPMLLLGIIMILWKKTGKSCNNI